MPDILKSYNDVQRRNVDMGDGTYAEVVTFTQPSLVACTQTSLDQLHSLL
jgi:hypothetical protein